MLKTLIGTTDPQNYAQYLNEKIEIGLLPQIQASMLAKFLRSDIDDYPVFLIQ